MKHDPSNQDRDQAPLWDALTDTVAPQLEDGDYTVSVRMRVQSGSVTAWSPPRVIRQE